LYLLQHDIMLCTYMCYLISPLWWADCSVLRLYRFGPMRFPRCNHKVTGNGYEAVNSCEAVDKWS